MIDWVDSCEARNYGIKHQTDSRNLMELFWLLSTLLVLAGVFVFHSWEQSQIVNMGYEIQHLQRIEESLVRVQKALILEEETLKDPQRIDEIARNLLGMAPLQPQQVLSPGYVDVELGTATTLALAAGSPTLSGSKKQGASN